MQERGILAEDLHHRLRLDHRRVDRVRVDRVHPDTELARFDRQRVGQRDQTVLGGRIVGVARGRLGAGRRADDDDRPTVARFDHGGHRRSDRAPGAVEVDVDDGVPLLFGHLPDASPAEHAGVGHHDVQATELLHGVGDDLLLGGQIPDVELAADRLASGGLDLTHRFAEIVGGRHRVGHGVRHRRAHVDRNHVGAVVGEPDRVCPPLSARGAGDQRDPPLQGRPSSCHGCVLSVSRERAGLHADTPHQPYVMRALEPDEDQANTTTRTCSRNPSVTAPR